MSGSTQKEDEATKSVEECSRLLRDVKSNIDALQEHDFQEVHDKLSSLESAKLSVGVAFSLASLLYISIK
jgi:hypothetical protein